MTEPDPHRTPDAAGAPSPDAPGQPAPEPPARTGSTSASSVQHTPSDTVVAPVVSPDEHSTARSDTRVGGEPGDRPVAAPLSERARYETMPGTTRGEHIPPDRSSERQPVGPTDRATWRPDVDTDRTDPAWSTRPVAVRRSDSVAAFALLLAGIAAGLSLLLAWTPDGRTGLDLARDGLDQLSSNWTGVFDTGIWQPLTVLAGGALLFVLGLLVLIPARTHRFLGVLALLISLAVVAAVLVPLADKGWDLGAFDLGFFFALAVAALGLLGALKATLTGTRHA